MSSQPPANRPLEPLQPKRMGRYTLLRPLCAEDSSSWETSLAHTQSSTGFDRLCVVKRAKPQHAAHGDFVRRLVAEARLLSELQNGAIAQLLDSGVHAGVPFLAFELVDGKDVEQLLLASLERREALPIPVVLYVGVRVLEGLSALYRKYDGDPRFQGRPYRNLHPANVVVSFDGEVKLVGLGAPHLARATCGASVDGYPGASRDGDLFDVGALLYELATGTKPAEAATDATGVPVLGAPRALPSPGELNAQCPAGLDSVISRALGFEPARRYAGPEELRAPLLKLLLELDPSGGVDLTARHLRAVFATEFRAAQAALENARGQLDDTRNPFEVERAVTRPYGPLPRVLTDDLRTDPGARPAGAAGTEGDVTQPTPRGLLGRPLVLLGEEPPSVPSDAELLLPRDAALEEAPAPRTPPQRGPPPRVPEGSAPVREAADAQPGRGAALDEEFTGEGALLEPTPSEPLIASEPPHDRTPAMPLELMQLKEPSELQEPASVRALDAPAGMDATGAQPHSGDERGRRASAFGSSRGLEAVEPKASPRQSRARLPRAGQRKTQGEAGQSRSVLPKVPARARATRGESEGVPPREAPGRPEAVKNQRGAGAVSRAALVAAADDAARPGDGGTRSPDTTPLPPPPHASSAAGTTPEGDDDRPEDTYANVRPAPNRWGSVVAWLTLPLVLLLAGGTYLAWIGFSERLREQQIAAGPPAEQALPARGPRPPGSRPGRPGRPATTAAPETVTESPDAASEADFEADSGRAAGEATALRARPGSTGTDAGRAPVSPVLPTSGEQPAAKAPAEARVAAPLTATAPGTPQPVSAASVRRGAAAPSAGGARPASSGGGAAAAAADAEFDAEVDEERAEGAPGSPKREPTRAEPARSEAPGRRARPPPAVAGDEEPEDDGETPARPSGGTPSPGRTAFDQMHADFERLSDEAAKRRFRLRVNMLADKLELSGYEPAFLRSVKSLHEAIRGELSSPPGQ